MEEVEWPTSWSHPISLAPVTKRRTVVSKLVAMKEVRNPQHRVSRTSSLCSYLKINTLNPKPERGSVSSRLYAKYVLFPRLVLFGQAAVAVHSHRVQKFCEAFLSQYESFINFQIR